ncbi:kinase-like domain-containing protein [Baffinella frigidus]|nr:kinase-like domain-containing protein [Cryptophyta sp. CCMP2293]
MKGGNILVTEEGVIKLADFNSSKQLGNLAGGGSNPLRSLLGTPHFMAPEVIRQTGHGKKADIWSMGCTVIQMLTGEPPWNETSNTAAVLFKIASAKAPPSIPPGVSPHGAAFLSLVLSIDPALRPICADLLSHPFITEPVPPSEVDQIEDRVQTSPAPVPEASTGPASASAGPASGLPAVGRDGPASGQPAGRDGPASGGQGRGGLFDD